MSYWPSSPSSDTPFENPTGSAQGDAHYWDVWHGRKPFTPIAISNPRFKSELGFQALPPLATIRTYAEEKDWNMTSYIMARHQKNDSGNHLMVRSDAGYLPAAQGFRIAGVFEHGLAGRGHSLWGGNTGVAIPSV